MLADTPAEKNPLSGCTLIQSCCRRPTPNAPTNASGRLVIRPITTAANEPTSNRVNWNSCRPTMGESSTPANPASITPTIHDPAVTISVFTPAMAALRGWSTVMRVASPIDVRRSTNVATSAITAALTITTNWFSFTQVPKIRRKFVSAGLDTSPSGLKISVVAAVKRMRVIAGSATHRPTVDTRRTVGVAWVSRRNRRK